MNNLNIFVSSTCYDLSQLRTNIKTFIEESGHTPILSEFNSFPVSPDLNAVENCIKNVKENADILILIVGNRYGSIIESGKSITNTEFLTAKQKGIPVFCFIDKKTLNALSFWRDNQQGDFKNFVDNKQIFEFIDDIRSKQNLWVFTFEQSQEIIDTLKIQLSFLFKESLKIKSILDKNVDDLFKLNLSEKCLKILIEKNEFFEFDFLAQSFIDEISKKEFLKNDIEYSILVEPQHFINDIENLGKWSSNRLQSLKNTVSNFSNLFIVLIKFINEQGKPSDIKGIYYCSIKYAHIFGQIIHWMIDVKSTCITNEYSDLKIHLADMASKAVQQIWDYPFEIKTKLENIKEQKLLGNKVDSIVLNLKLEINDEAESKLNEILKKMMK
ncbi:MAG: DUF4062 domain-containing protein [Ginsengibacter sp.]